MPGVDPFTGAVMVGLVGFLLGAVWGVLVGIAIVCLMVTGTFLLPFGFLGWDLLWVLFIADIRLPRPWSVLGLVMTGFWGIRMALWFSWVMFSCTDLELVIISGL